MSFTFEQLMSGEGLPKECVRKAATMKMRSPGKFDRVPRVLRDSLASAARISFRDFYGKDADTVYSAEESGEFICIAYRTTP